MNRPSKKICSILMGIVSLLSLSICTVENCAAQSKIVKPGTDTNLIKQKLKYAIKHEPMPDSAIILATEALQLSLEANYYQGILDMYTLIARSYSAKGDYLKAVQTNRKLLAVEQKPIEKANTYLNIGICYLDQGEYTPAVKNFDSGLQELQKASLDDDPRVFFMTYNSLAILNMKFNQDNLALYYYHKAEELARTKGLHRNLTLVLGNMASYYQEHKQLDSAYRLITEAVEVVKKHDIKREAADVEQAMGSVCLDSGLYDKAIAYLKSSLDPEKLKYSPDPLITEIYSQSFLAQTYVAQKKYKLAEPLADSALKKAKAMHVRDVVCDVYDVLVKMYRANGQYKKALDYYDSLVTLRNDITSKENANAMNDLQVKYHSAEKDKKLTQSMLMIAQQNSELTRSRMLILSTSGIVLLLLMGAAWIYVHNRHRHKILLNEHKIEILKAAMAGEDNERFRIARELHDGIGGMLSAAMMRFSSMHHDSPAITRTAAYNDAMGILREMGDEIRKTAHNLMPEVLLKQSLPEVIRAFCNNVQEGNKVKIDFQCYGAFDDLTQSIKLNIYRISQELIKNALVHSGANRISVQLLQDDGTMMLSVEDNGSGFNVNERKSGLGLHNIRTRVLSIDGHMTLESDPGKGTTAIIEFGLVPHAAKEMAV